MDAIDHAITVLNEMNEADPVAMLMLIKHRVRCNEELAAHGSIQVNRATDGVCDVGMFGLINGMFGLKPSGNVYIIMDCEYPADLPATPYSITKIHRFRRTTDKDDKGRE
jgi:hypothetical protein